MINDYCLSEQAYKEIDCNDLILKLESAVDLGYVDDYAYGNKKTSNVKIVSYGSIKNEMQRLRNMVLDINKNFFGFDLFEINDFIGVNYNKYSAANNGQYNWHSDDVKEKPYDIKLTAILNLSDEEYEGGDFSLFINGEQKIEKFNKRGSLIVFPSWIQHRVSPVTKNSRKTLTLFLTGPNLK